MKTWKVVLQVAAVVLLLSGVVAADSGTGFSEPKAPRFAQAGWDGACILLSISDTTDEPMENGEYRYLGAMGIFTTIDGQVTGGPFASNSTAVKDCPFHDADIEFTLNLLDSVDLNDGEIWLVGPAWVTSKSVQIGAFRYRPPQLNLSNKIWDPRLDPPLEYLWVEPTRTQPK